MKLSLALGIVFVGYLLVYSGITGDPLRDMLLEGVGQGGSSKKAGGKGKREDRKP